MISDQYLILPAPGTYNVATTPKSAASYDLPPKESSSKTVPIAEVEDALVTVIVAFVLAAMVLAYLCLCCHVWGLHLRILQLLRSVGHEQSRSRGEVVEETNAVPMIGRYLTPPPRYSAINTSLPSYSCALNKMLRLVHGPVQLRFIIYIDQTVGNNSVFTGCTVSQPSFSNQRPLNAPSNVSPTENAEPHRRFSLHSILVSQRPSTENSNNLVARQTNLRSHRSSPSLIVTECSESADREEMSGLNVSPICAAQNDSINQQNLKARIVSVAPHSSTPLGVFASGETGEPGSSSPLVNSDVVDEIPRNNGSVTSSAIYPQCSSIYPSPADSNELRLPENPLKVLMRGVGGADQVVLAQRSAPNCFIANWPLRSKDEIDSNGFEVLVDDQPVENMYLEFLNADGLSLGMTQLLPSPSSGSVEPRVQCQSWATVTSVQTPSEILSNSPSASLPPPYHP